MIRPKNEIEDFLLSITKKCETLIHQIYTRPEETLEFYFIKPKETFPFNPTIQMKGDWMIGLTSLENNNSLFFITEESYKIDFYKFLDEKTGGDSYEKVWNETERDLNISDITETDLQTI